MKNKARRAPEGSATFRLVYRAEILPGHQAEAVRSALVAALKLDKHRAARLFSGKRTVVRRAVDEDTALRYVARLAELGARLRAEPEPPPNWTPEFAQQFLLDQDRAAAWSWRKISPAGVVAALSSLGFLLASGLWLFWTPAASTHRTAVTASPSVARSSLPAVSGAPPEWAKAPPETVVTPARPASETDLDALASLPPAAVREYRQAYAVARGHKAFAVSEKGAHAWISGAATADSARESALSRCVVLLAGAETGCSILDADGELEK